MARNNRVRELLQTLNGADAALGNTALESSYYPERGGDVPHPPDGYKAIYAESDGVYVVDENDQVTGPLGEGGTGSFDTANEIYVRNGDTIQGAVNSLNGWHGGSIFITGDYDPSVETWPVTIDSKCEIRMAGTDRLVNPTTADATPKDTFHVDLGGPNEYPGVRFRDVTVEGGRDAFYCTEARYVTFDNCLAEGQTRHGWHIHNQGTTPTSYVYNRCVGEDAVGDGWHIDGNTIGHTWYDCTGEQNGGAAITSSGVVNRASIYDGSWQLNGDEAFNFANGFNASQIIGAYIEANDENNREQEVLIDNAFAYRVEGCRFNGFGNSMDALVRGPNYGLGGEIANCAFLNYDGIAIDVRGGRDQEIRLPTHYHNSVTTEYANAGLRTRSGGVMLAEENLGAPGNAGQFDGDRAIADASITTSGNPELAVYDMTAGEWNTTGGDTYVT